MNKPLIGLTVDSSCDTSYSIYPWYALRENYADSIHQAGGIPILIPHSIDLVEHYIDLIDGLVITGGDFDHDPKLYGDDEIHEKTTVNPERTAFEYSLLQQALKVNLPFLGICAGQQLLNIVRGGTLIQYIPDAFPKAINHNQSECRHKPTHDVTVKEGTLLRSINNNKASAYVNTSHNQAVKKVGENLVVNAIAVDGVIEGIEDPNHDFCLGIQWHPEFFVGDLDREIFMRFIQAAMNNK